MLVLCIIDSALCIHWKPTVVTEHTYGSAEGLLRIMKNWNLLSNPDDLRVWAYAIRMINEFAVTHPDELSNQVSYPDDLLKFDYVIRMP